MFYVFDSTGRTFEGTLEALRTREKTPAILPEQPLANRSDIDSQTSDPSQGSRTSAYAISSKNAKQYSDMLSEQGSREIVYHAYQVMTQPAECISAHWPLSQVAQCFHDFPYQVFPIVDDVKQLVGLLSRRHFYEFSLGEASREKSASSTAAQCFLTPDTPVYCTDPVTDVRRIATLLVENNLDAIPVVEPSGRLVGIVSRTDVLKCVISDPPLSLWC